MAKILSAEKFSYSLNILNYLTQSTCWSSVHFNYNVTTKRENYTLKIDSFSMYCLYNIFVAVLLH